MRANGVEINKKTAVCNIRELMKRLNGLKLETNPLLLKIQKIEILYEYSESGNSKSAKLHEVVITVGNRMILPFACK